ncbi:hypothetical protein AB3S75_032307 [Citrus x aurantiifolia]
MCKIYLDASGNWQGSSSSDKTWRLEQM